MIGRKFKSFNTLAKAVSELRKAGVQHDFYCHYTTLESVRLMMQSKTLWLRRCSSEEFDDRIEKMKFGKKEEQEKFYLACFSHENQELASMWGLYCPPTYQAVRLRIPGDVMKNWERTLKSSVFGIESGRESRKLCLDVVSTGIADIVYASVKSHENDVLHDGTLWWNGQKTRPIEGLGDKASWTRATGFVKDIDWKFEAETRLWVKTRERLGVEQVAVDLPNEVIQSMEFTLSPWLKDYEEDFVRGLIRKWVGDACGDKGDGIRFVNSGLRGGLLKWAARRGL